MSLYASATSASSERSGRKIRVLFLNNAPFIEGAQINIRNLIRVMDRVRFETLVAIPTDRLGLAPVFGEFGAEVVGIPMERITPLTAASPLENARSVHALIRLVRARRIDVIHSHMQRAGILVPPVKWATGVRIPLFSRR